MSRNSDILENDILAFDPELLAILLIDRSKSKALGEDRNIIWATDNYAKMGTGYGENDEIKLDAISGKNGLVLQPRVNKSKEEQEYRSRDKAKVFTPVWICNKQNNLVDAAWFAGESPFNKENEDNKVEYGGVAYSIADFTAKFMQENKISKSGVCKGPKYFSYNGVSLYKLKESFLKKS